MAYNAAERKDVRRAEKESKVAEAQRAEVLRTLMSIAGSRAWMHSLLTDCHIFASSFTTNPYSTAFNEGARNVGLKLLADIMAGCPDYYTLMMVEADGRRSASDRRAEGQPGNDSGPEPEASAGGGEAGSIWDDPADEIGRP
jgi:hypothetical protein